MTKLEMLARSVNDSFATQIQHAFRAQFDGVEIETWLDFLGDMNLHSSRRDGRPLTKAMKEWIAVWEAGYLTALTLIRRAGGRDREVGGTGWVSWSALSDEEIPE